MGELRFQSRILSQCHAVGHCAVRSWLWSGNGMCRPKRTNMGLPPASVLTMLRSQPRHFSHIVLRDVHSQLQWQRSTSLISFLVFPSRSHLAWVEEEWKSRRSWWPAFHFSFFWAKSDWKADADLAFEKAFVAGILLGKGLCFFPSGFVFVWM